MMTQRHYVEIAKVLGLYRRLEPSLIDDLSRDLAEVFAQDNPAFKRQRFFSAVGVQ